MLTKLNAVFSTWIKRVKMIFMWLGIWGFIFSVVSIAGLKAGFDYDDTLVFSTPAVQKALVSGTPADSLGYWKTLNQAYDAESIKPASYAAAWFLRIFGFKIYVITERNNLGAEALIKSWKPLISGFIFVQSSFRKSQILSSDKFVLFIGDSDTDMKQARSAGVIPVRIKRSQKSIRKTEDYTPGSFGEFVLPVSQF